MPVEAPPLAANTFGSTHIQQRGAFVRREEPKKHFLLPFPKAQVETTTESPNHAAAPEFLADRQPGQQQLLIFLESPSARDKRRVAPGPAFCTLASQ
jgi:hypothetical protein